MACSSFCVGTSSSHLLLGSGHDAQFNDAEEKWPEYADLKLQLATLHERWNTEPSAYR